MVDGAGFRVPDSGSPFQASEFGVQGVECRVQGVGSGV